jgi:GNAT superfamily N-acetyltransferase
MNEGFSPQSTFLVRTVSPGPKLDVESVSREVHVLSAAHADGIRALSMEPDVAAAAGLDVALSPEATIDHIAVATKAREEGRAYVFVLTDGDAVLGICRLIGLLGVPRLIVAVGHAYRGKGNGSFLVRHVLEFAFETLHEERVTATGACLALVSQFGRVGGSELTRQAWRAAGGSTTSGPV